MVFKLTLKETPNLPEDKTCNFFISFWSSESLHKYWYDDKRGRTIHLEKNPQVKIYNMQGSPAVIGSGRDEEITISTGIGRPHTFKMAREGELTYKFICCNHDEIDPSIFKPGSIWTIDL
jgi:hypothetical protein